MKGTLYGVGVGPGDPELMTLKAVRMIRENDIIAVPGADTKLLFRLYPNWLRRNFFQSTCL